MLTSLSIQDVVLIESLTLSFDNGFSVFTGETGAGKSILLDSLSLAMGMRGDSSLIRHGCEQARVTAVFDLSGYTNTPVSSILTEQGLALESDDLILTRILQANNRGKAFVNNQPVTISFLKELGQYLVDIHGQFDNLLDPNQHHRILDQFTKVLQPDFPNTLQHLAKAYDTWQEYKKALDSFYLHQQEIQARRHYYEGLLGDLNALKPLPNEEEELLDKRSQTTHFAKLCEGVQEAYKTLQSPVDVLNSLTMAQKSLTRANTIDHPKMAEVTKMLDNAGVEITEALQQLKELQHLFGDDAQATQIIDERLHALRSVARQHNIPTPDLHNTWQIVQNALGDIDDSSLEEKTLKARVDEISRQLQMLAEKAHEARKKAACEIERLIALELPDLKLPQAQFSVVFSKKDVINAHGFDIIEFHVSTNKGQAFSPLHKVASGGEMARFMLALKMVLWKTQTACTLVFDEIDTGVGGAAAAAIGQRLQRLGAHSQVFSITHSPQVAAYGKSHFLVQKSDHDHKTMTQVLQLSQEDRRHEIARMLSGDHITPEALAAADRLLDHPL